MNEEEIKKYCLNCKIKPCSNKGCPLANNIPEFIHEENPQKAFEILCETTVLPAICGRICPHEKQCQGSCIRGIKGEPVSIGEMEALIGDISIQENYKIPRYEKGETLRNKSDKTVSMKSKTDMKQGLKSIKNEEYDTLKTKKVAIIGGGPAGLTCAAFLARCGVQVTIYEKHNELGGMLTHGIPEFRLPKGVVKQTIEKILELGIKVELNKELGKNLNLQDIINENDAVFIAIGANIPAKMNIEGENLEGVYGGNRLLENNNHPSYINKKVAIIGGGNVAMDSARTIQRLGADKVYIIYRRAEEQMPAEKKEIEAAKKEGIEFLFQTNIVKILSNNDINKMEKPFEHKIENNSKENNVSKNTVSKIECIKTKLVQKEGETRLSPVNIEGSNYLMDIDYVIMATGSKPEIEVIQQFERNKWDYIQINENMQTSIPKVFAGGDIVGEKATVAWAARSGRDAAENIIRYLK